MKRDKAREIVEANIRELLDKQAAIPNVLEARFKDLDFDELDIIHLMLNIQQRHHVDILDICPQGKPYNVDDLVDLVAEAPNYARSSN